MMIAICREHAKSYETLNGCPSCNNEEQGPSYQVEYTTEPDYKDKYTELLEKHHKVQDEYIGVLKELKERLDANS